MRTDQKSAAKTKAKSFDNLLSPKSSSSSSSSSNLYQTVQSCFSFSSEVISKDEVATSSSTMENNNVSQHTSIECTPALKTDKEIFDRSKLSNYSQKTLVSTQTVPTLEIDSKQARSSPSLKSFNLEEHQLKVKENEATLHDQKPISQTSPKVDKDKVMKPQGSPISRAIRSFGGPQVILRTSYLKSFGFVALKNPSLWSFCGGMVDVLFLFCNLLD